jgi:hypothetical protein
VSVVKQIIYFGTEGVQDTSSKSHSPKSIITHAS